MFVTRLFGKHCRSSSWPVAYEFIVDRLRAVRQDMIIQNTNSKERLLLLEAMIPFYIESQYRLFLKILVARVF